MKNYVRHQSRALAILTVALCVPFTGGRLIYHCGITGQDYFGSYGSETASSPAACCLEASHSPQAESRPGDRDAPCGCCDVKVLTLDGWMPPASRTLVGEVLHTLATSHLSLRSSRAAFFVLGDVRGNSPLRLPPKYILHVSFLI